MRKDMHAWLYVTLPGAIREGKASKKICSPCCTCSFARLVMDNFARKSMISLGRTAKRKLLDVRTTAT
jgi:hypothetical protein